MDGKYIKLKRIIIPTITMILISSMLFGVTVCSQKESFDMLQQTDQIELEYAEPSYGVTEDGTEVEIKLIPWLALGNLETNPELRQAFDAFFGITGETGNKVGSIYYNTDTEQADQNVTLYMVLKNLAIRDNFRNPDSLEALGKIALDNYIDIDEGDVYAPYAAINAYFSLLPDEAPGEFNGDATISRAQAMALLMRATTQATEDGKPVVNKDFTSAVGESQFTDFAAPMNEFAYINTSNGLNQCSFMTSMTRGEYICMVTNLIVADYKASLTEQGFVDAYSGVEVTLTTIKDGGNITLVDALKDPALGAPVDMYNTFKTAIQYGLLTEEALEDWDISITKAEAVELFTSMAINYTTDAGQTVNKDGYKSEEQLTKEELGLKENQETARFGASLPGEGTGMAKFLAWVRSQGADTASGWSFIYTHGDAAGDQPSYAVYMKPGSPDYGKVFHVGDTLPNGRPFWGTAREHEAYNAKQMEEQLIEDGNLTIDPETGKKIYSF